MLWVVILLGAAAVLLLWRSNCAADGVLYTKIGGPKPLPIVGNLFDLDLDNIPASVARLSAKHGPTFVLYFGPTPNVVLLHPSDLREMFLTRWSVFDRSWMHIVTREIHGAHALIALENKPWVPVRQAMARAFQTGQLLFMELLQERIPLVIDRLRGESCLDIGPVLGDLALDVVTSWTFGVDANSLSNAASPLKQAVQYGMQYGYSFLTFPFPRSYKYANPIAAYYWRKSDSFIRRTIREMVAKRRAELANGIARPDLLGLVEASVEPSVLEDQARMMINAGDTMPSALRWAFYCLAKYPNHQDEVRNEVRAVLGDQLARGQYLTAEHVAPHNVPKLTAFLNEVMRMHPPVQFPVGRVLLEPVTLPSCDVTLPAGTTVAYCCYATHRLPELWPDPDRFDPSRFASLAPDDLRFMPFLHGRRNCIGRPLALLALPVVVSRLVDLFDFRLQDPGFEPQITKSLVSHPHKVPVHVTPRSDAVATT